MNAFEAQNKYWFKKAYCFGEVENHTLNTEFLIAKKTW